MSDTSRKILGVLTISPDLFGLDKVENSIELLKTMEPKEGYFLAFSGGKDSQVIYKLAELAGVKFEAHYYITTVDPPELVKFIRENYPDVSMDRPKKTMWQLIATKCYPPTRMVRYCCDYLKERGGQNRVVITGVRADESPRRKYRQQVESCIHHGQNLVNPIIWWTEEEVWRFIRGMNMPYCSLYDKGWKRIGCVGCPLAVRETRIRELEAYPKIKMAYLSAFKRMLLDRETRGKFHKWDTPEDVMNWWLEIDEPDTDGATGLFS
jgi:phosphoadenosine phosphosulfate reductase